MTPLQSVTICSAHRQDGQPCRAKAIRGGTVCSVHGGLAPQVLAKAKLRLLMGADLVAERLLGVALTAKSKRRDSDVIAACKDILDRAGVRSERDAQGTSNGAIQAKIEVVFVTPEQRPDDSGNTSAFSHGSQLPV